MLVRKSEVFVEYEPANELPLRWAYSLAADLRRSGNYRAVKVSKSRVRDGVIATGRVWVDQSSGRALRAVAGTGEAFARPATAESNVGGDSENGEVA